MRCPHIKARNQSMQVAYEFGAKGVKSITKSNTQQSRK